MAVAIGPLSNFGVCVGMDDDHQITVLDLKKKRIVATEKGGKKVILKLGWIS